MIRVISKKELNFALNLTEVEEWGTTKEELEDLLLFSPQGFFISEINGILNGIISTAFYGSFGVIGNLIVLRQYRRQGLGKDLMEYAIRYLKSKGANTILLDAVPQVISLYKKLGFQAVCRSLRLERKKIHKSVHSVRMMTLNDIPEVIDLDKKHFGGERAYMLERRFTLHPEYCYVLIKEKKLNGFIMGIPKENFLFIGPWIVNPKEPEPQLLLQGLCNNVHFDKVKLGILENNKKAVRLVRDLNFNQYFYSIRMIYGKSFSHSDGLLALAGPDRG